MAARLVAPVLVSAWKSKLAGDDQQYRQLRASIREACDYLVCRRREPGRSRTAPAAQCRVTPVQRS